MIADGRLGKKAKKGFYLYEKSGKGLFAKKGKQVDTSIYRLLNIEPEGRLSEQEVAKRCLYLMLNEAARCLDEGIIRNARDGDIGAIFGIGFPPFLGGPFRYMDKVGLVAVVKQLNHWANEHGDRFTPCDKLVAMAEAGENFY